MIKHYELLLTIINPSFLRTGSLFFAPQSGTVEGFFQAGISEVGQIKLRLVVLCGCIYIHIYIYIHTYIYIYIHTHIYTHIYTYTHIYIYTYIYIHTYIYTHTHIYTHIYIYTYIYTYIYIHIYIYTHTHTYIYTYIYIYTHIYIYIHTYIHVYIYRYHYISGWIIAIEACDRSLESWLIRGIIPEWPQVFRLVNYNIICPDIWFYDIWRFPKKIG